MKKQRNPDSKKGHLNSSRREAFLSTETRSPASWSSGPPGPSAGENSVRDLHPQQGRGAAALRLLQHKEAQASRHFPSLIWPRSARPSARRTLPLPAARSAPLTRRPVARGRHAPRTQTGVRPPRRPANKARTAAHTPRPEVGPRPRPGSFRCRSRRFGAGRPLGGAGFRPACGGGAGSRGGGAEQRSSFCAPAAPSAVCLHAVNGCEGVGFRRAVNADIEDERSSGARPRPCGAAPGPRTEGRFSERRGLLWRGRRGSRPLPAPGSDSRRLPPVGLLIWKPVPQRCEKPWRAGGGPRTRTKCEDLDILSNSWVLFGRGNSKYHILLGTHIRVSPPRLSLLGLH
ncbi:translation initiation factor IF-2-like [Camelus ferus]|uniref:Translation initiation factor IF-2-like n=1 Tax=Camelus ferus TaxID=419612 RepID=A0A8B8S1C4_CAMFR|nr:translation initiation factor IF-2-like [Camelus ferus]